MSTVDMHRRNVDLLPETEPATTSSTTKSQNHKSKRNILNVIKSKLFISIVIVIAVFITLLCIGLVVAYEKDNDVTHTIDAWKDKLSEEQAAWFDSGMDELKEALRIKINTRRAKNVILFVGDGMGPNTVTATRIHKYGEDGQLVWEKFPHMGSLKTYSADKLVPDSAAAATALFGGVKGNSETSGVDSGVLLGDCNASMNKLQQVDSILQWAQDEGMATGFVTTTRVVHATPAALYAHSPHRKWECESQIPEIAKQRGCLDIARQLIENEPGRNFNVIMGGGRQCLETNVTGSIEDPIDKWSCYSADGRQLITDWRNDKNHRGMRNVVVQNTEELKKVDLAEIDYILGIFANGHMAYEDQRNNGSKGMPSLKHMTEAAISILSKSSKGFVLVVEGGLIDQAHHRGWVKRAISETAALDDAVEVAVNLLKSQIDESLIIVTSDHAHTLSFNGYPERGDGIFKAGQKSKYDKIPYTTLTYGTGGPESFQIEIGLDGKPHRHDPTSDNINAFDYVPKAAIVTDENTHGGTDVAIHAIGPMAHLFHRVHEQSYVAHVISYAARIGRFRDNQLVQSYLALLGLD